MVFVDPETKQKYAEESDYLTEVPTSMSALSGEFTVWWSTSTSGREVRAWGTNPIGNSTAGTFVINGVGKLGATSTGSNSTSGALISQTYVDAAAGAALLARIHTFLSTNFGAFAVTQFPSLVNNTVITGLPGTIRIGDSDWWGAGQQWQRVHPAFQRPSDDSDRIPAGDDGDPPYSRLGWQWEFYRPDTDPAWLRWLTFGRSEHGHTGTQWPGFALESDGDVWAYAQVPADQTNAYIRCMTHDGEGFTSSSSATAALGLTSSSGDGRHFGNDKGIAGLDAVSMSTVGDSKRIDDLQNLAWDSTTPFRWQLWTNSVESQLLTGTDWSSSAFTHLVADVEVYPPAAVGPEIPAGIETLVADTLPRVTSRIRLRTGIDGGSP